MTEETKKPEAAETIDDMIRKWNIAGTAYLTSTYPFWFRIFWLFLLMLMIALMMYQILDVTSQYRANGVSSEYKSRTKDRLEFPTINFWFPAVLNYDDIAEKFGQQLADALLNAQQPISRDDMASIFEEYKRNGSLAGPTRLEPLLDPNNYKNLFSALQPKDFQVSACIHHGFTFGDSSDGTCLEEVISFPDPHRRGAYLYSPPSLAVPLHDRILWSIHVQLKMSRRRLIMVAESQAVNGGVGVKSSRRHRGEMAVMTLDDFYGRSKRIEVYNGSAIDVSLESEIFIDTTKCPECEHISQATCLTTMSIRERQERCISDQVYRTGLQKCNCTGLAKYVDEKHNCTSLDELYCQPFDYDQYLALYFDKCSPTCAVWNIKATERYHWIPNLSAVPNNHYHPARFTETHEVFPPVLYPRVQVNDSFVNDTLEGDGGMKDQFHLFNDTSAANASSKPSHGRDEVLPYDFASITLYWAGAEERIVYRRPQYNIWRLASDIGGTVGLYMGCCLAALIEICFSCTKIEQKIRSYGHHPERLFKHRRRRSSAKIGNTGEADDSV